MKIEVRSTVVNVKKGTSKAGKPFEIPEQEVRAEFNDEVRKVRIALQDGQAAYPVGLYALADSSFVVNQYGGFEIGRVTLVPIKG